MNEAVSIDAKRNQVVSVRIGSEISGFIPIFWQESAEAPLGTAGSEIVVIAPHIATLRYGSGHVRVSLQVALFIPTLRQESAGPRLDTASTEIVVIAAYKVTLRDCDGHVRLDLQVTPFIPICRHRGALTSFGPPGKLVMLPARLEVVPGNRGRHILVHGEIKRLVPV